MGMREDKQWIVYNELRYRYKEAEGTILHYLLFELEAIPQKVIMSEWGLQNKSKAYRLVL